MPALKPILLGTKTVLSSWITLRTAMMPAIWNDNIHNSEQDDPNSSIYHMIKHNDLFQELAKADNIRAISMTVKVIDFSLSAAVFLGAATFSLSALPVLPLLPTINLAVSTVDLLGSGYIKWTSSDYEASTLKPMIKNIDAAYHAAESDMCPTKEQIEAIMYFAENRDNIGSDHLDKENYYAYIFNAPITAWKIFYKTASSPQETIDTFNNIITNISSNLASMWKSVVNYGKVEPARKNNLEDQARYILTKEGNCTSVPQEAKNFLDILGRNYSDNMPNEKILEDPTLISDGSAVRTIEGALAFLKNFSEDEISALIGQLSNPNEMQHHDEL